MDKWAKQHFDLDLYPWQKEFFKDNRKRKFAAWGRRTGQTTCAILETIRYMTQKHDRRKTVAVFAPTRRGTDLFFNTLIRTLGLSKPLHKQVTSVRPYPHHRIETPNCTVLEAREYPGFYADKIIVEDALYLQDKQIYDSILPIVYTWPKTEVSFYGINEDWFRTRFSCGEQEEDLDLTE